MAGMENVLVVGFGEPSKAYQALSVLKQCDAEGRIALRSATVVERTSAGELITPEGTDNVGLIGTASGSMIGMLVGVLGGPVGVLVGWGAGALMGGVFDIARVEASDDALSALGKAIPLESTAVIAGVEEPAVEVIDGEMAKLGGEVTRRPLDEVMSELEAAEMAAEAAALEARRTLHRSAQGRGEGELRRARGQAEGDAARLLTAANARRRHSPATGSGASADGRSTCHALRFVRRAAHRGRGLVAGRGGASHPARGLGVDPDDPADRRRRRRRVGAGVDRERPSRHLRLRLQRRRPLAGGERDGAAAPLEPEAVRSGARAGDRDRPRGGRAGGDAGGRRRRARLQRRPPADRRRGQAQRSGQLRQQRERLARDVGAAHERDHERSGQGVGRRRRRRRLGVRRRDPRLLGDVPDAIRTDRRNDACEAGSEVFSTGATASASCRSPIGSSRPPRATCSATWASP